LPSLRTQEDRVLPSLHGDYPQQQAEHYLLEVADLDAARRCYIMELALTD
jgi:hypothetical protein